MTGPIARATIRTSGVLGLRFVVQAGSLLLVTRLLGPVQYGAFAGVASLAVLLGALSTLGTHLVLLAEISRDATRRERVLRYAIPCTLLCGCGLLMCYQLVCAWWLDVGGVSTGVLLLIGATETLLQPLFLLMVSEHHALGRIARSQLLQMLPMVLRLLTATLVFVLQPPQALACYAVGYAAASLVALGYGRCTLGAGWPSWRHWRLPDRREWHGALGYAAINITKASPGELDKTLALRLLPHGAAGLYAAAARVVGAIALPVTAMTLSALPRLFREAHAPGGRQLLRWMYGAASAYSLLLAGALWLAAPGFNVLFGTHYEGVGDVVRVLCLAVPGMALRLVAGNALMALGRPWMRAGFEAVGMMVLAFASVPLVRNSGVLGLPLALTCAEWAMALVGAWMVARVRSPNVADDRQS